MRLRNLRPPGMRNIKTALSVFCCLLLYAVIGREHPIYALLAAVICTMDTVEGSIRIGLHRLAGTVVGGIFGTGAVYLIRLFPPGNAWRLLDFLCIAVGISAIIFVCVTIGIRQSVSIGCIVFLIVVVQVQGQVPYVYAANRVLDTAIGIAVAVTINRLLFPRFSEREERREAAEAAEAETAECSTAGEGPGADGPHGA